MNDKDMVSDLQPLGSMLESFIPYFWMPHVSLILKEKNIQPKQFPAHLLHRVPYYHTGCAAGMPMGYITILPMVLDYIEDYYMGDNPTGDLISVTFHVDEEISYTAEYAAINDEEFSNIETQYNDHDNGYYSKWKWVLFGTTVEGGPDVIGYTYVITQGKDILAGNYIFIADKTADDWATENQIKPYGAEAAVLMHELGHSIGIGKWHPAFGEQYDPDPYSVMSYLTTYSAGNDWAWYYSDEYWATRNMEYYTL